jgi:Ca2+-binding RTX toxin-like protein
MTTRTTGTMSNRTPTSDMLAQPLPDLSGALTVGEISPGIDPPDYNPGRLINGTNNSDIIIGGASGTTPGPDTIYGAGGHDLILAGWGSDYIEGGTGNDTVYGEVGHDTIYGGEGMDSLYGGSGADFMAGGTEADQLFGDAGNDTLIGGTGNDTMSGGDDADTIFFGQGFDWSSGGEGNDVFIVWKGQHDTNLGIVQGGAGFDTIVLPNGTPLSSITFDDDFYKIKNPGKLTFGTGDDAAEIRLSSVEWIQVDGVYHPITDFLI